MNEQTLYQIALMTSKGMTCKHYRRLVEHFGEAKTVFEADAAELMNVIGSRAQAALKSILEKSALDASEKELSFIERNGVKVLEFRDPLYPHRLNDKGCEETPPLLYYKGNADLNPKRCVSIVGTRKATPYGHAETRRIVQQLKGIEGLLVVSGLAYGIDTLAHRSSIDNGIATVGVIGHGLCHLYPPENKNLARTMVDGDGGLLTEYTSDTPVSRNQFPARNRIVAALSDATLVIEAAEQGGALITARMANGYHREVFAVAGRNEDPYSAGCNNLIATGQAKMLRSVDDLATWMGWKTADAVPSYENAETTLFDELPPDEQKIVDALQEESVLTLDEIVDKTNLSLPKIAAAMLSLELKKRVITLAGKKYKLI